ncbi:MAG: BamA/TamA family outer membrane protein [Bacteroidales bacterium]|nr:BamA/TamA family outer membrane protein [Bacteroidales bacterium]
MKKVALFQIVLTAIFLLSGCAATYNVPKGQYVLKENKVKVTNPQDGYAGGDLLPYVKQGTGANSVIGIKSLFVEPTLLDSTYFKPTTDGMINHLEYLGYYNSKVDPTVKYSGKRAKVQYNVTLGKKFPINKMTFSVDDNLLASRLDSLGVHFNYKDVSYLSEDALEKEADRIAQILRNQGYYGFTKNYFFYYADTTAVRDSAKLMVELKNYTRNESKDAAKEHHTVYKIGDVSIIPTNGLKVRRNFLNNVNRIYPDAQYSETAINNAYQRYVSNRVFSSVKMDLSPRDSNYVDCNIFLSPSKMQSMRVNLEGSINSSGFWGISPQISYSHKNFFRGGENFNLSMKGRFQFLPNSVVGFGEYAVNASLAFPKFLLLPGRWFNGRRMPSTLLTLNFSYQDRPEYVRSIYSVNYGYSWMPSDYATMQITPARLNMTRIQDIDPEFYNSLGSTYLKNLYTNHFDLGGNVSFFLTTTTQTTPSDTYFYLRWQNDFSGNLLSLFNKYLEKDGDTYLIAGTPYAQYVRSQLSLVQTFFFGKNNQFQFAARLMGGAGYAYGNSTAIPLENMFFAGGASSLRGWQSRTIGPGDSPIDENYAIANQVGDMLLEANLEFRFPIVWKFKGALFADAGNIWNLPNPKVPDKKYVFDIRKIAETAALDWGVGLRLDFGLILVRVDLGIKQYDPVTKEWKQPNQWFQPNGYTVNFGIGYPF